MNNTLRAEASELFDGGEPVSAQDYHDNIINCHLIEDEA